MRAPAVIHAAAGCPSPRRATRVSSGRCYWCAGAIDGEACAVDDVITDSFTDQDQALCSTSALLCVGCAWAMTGRPPDTIRLWSIAYREDGEPWPANHAACALPPGRIHGQNKADPSAFRALLRDPPANGRWVCSIADSGQIHTLPFAPVNRGRGRYGVRYERVTIWTTPAQYAAIDDSISALLAAGYTKQDIAGDPFPGRLIACGVDLWRQHQMILSPWHNSNLLKLALFLARKEKASGSDPATEVCDRSMPRYGRLDVQREDPARRVVEPTEVSPRISGPELGQLRLAGVDDGRQASDRRDDGRDRAPPRRARRARD